MNETPLVSIIIPCYNEAGHIRVSFREITRTLDATRYSYEIIFVDDGSADDTREIIKELCASRENAIYIFHEKNKGRGGAVKTGVAAARGRIGGFLDVDLEVHCRYIPSMVQAVLDGAEVVCGNRWYRAPTHFDDVVRDILSLGSRFFVRKMLKIKLLDTEAGFKFFDLDKTRALLNSVQADGWFFDTEVMALAAYRGYKIAEIPQVFVRRIDKKSTVRPLRDAMESLRLLLEFRRRTRPGIIYRSPRLYHAVLRLVYHKDFVKRFKAVADQVPDGSSVVDVCCGPALIYDRFLKGRGVKYTGLDINPYFIAARRNSSGKIVPWDIELRGALPKADTLLMQCSLYQFIPRQDEILDKLFAAAGKRVVITEHVSSWSKSPNRLLQMLSHVATNPGTGPKTERFTPETLEQALARYKPANRISLCGGTEMLYVFDVENGKPES